MTPIETTKLSSKGQVVIPEAVRRALGLEAGTKFLVLVEGDFVILKQIEAPARGEVREAAARVRRQARKAGIKPADISRAVREVRQRG